MEHIADPQSNFIRLVEFALTAEVERMREAGEPVSVPAGTLPGLEAATLMQKLMVGVRQKKARDKPISSRTSHKLDKLVRVVKQRDERDQSIGFIPHPFVLCSLPFKRPPKTQLRYQRKNGDYTLTIDGDPEFGLPFGADALVPIWVATKYQLQKKNVPNPRMITMKSGAEFLKAFDLPLDGRSYKRVLERFDRIYGATIKFRRLNDREDLKARAHWFDSMRLWSLKSRGLNTNVLPECEFRIEISHAFAQDLERHPIPIDLRVSAALSDAPAAQWCYHWIVYRAFKQPAGQVASIPLFGAHGVIGQMGVGDGDYQGSEGNRNFRKKIRHWLGIIRAAWPECPAALDAAGDNLFIESGGWNGIVRT